MTTLTPDVLLLNTTVSGGLLLEEKDFNIRVQKLSQKPVLAIGPDHLLSPDTRVYIDWGSGVYFYSDIADFGGSLVSGYFRQSRVGSYSGETAIAASALVDELTSIKDTYDTGRTGPQYVHQLAMISDVGTLCSYLSSRNRFNLFCENNEWCSMLHYATVEPIVAFDKFTEESGAKSRGQLDGVFDPRNGARVFIGSFSWYRNLIGGPATRYATIPVFSDDFVKQASKLFNETGKPVVQLALASITYTITQGDDPHVVCLPNIESFGVYTHKRFKDMATPPYLQLQIQPA